MVSGEGYLEDEVKSSVWWVFVVVVVFFSLGGISLQTLS